MPARAGFEVARRALPRSRRHGAAVPAVRRGAAPARARASARATHARRLAAARVRGDARAARRTWRRAHRSLLVLEDLHWADTSTLDLVVYLAHNLDERRVLLLATYRADEPASAERVRRLADGVRRSGAALAARARSARAATSWRRCSRRGAGAPPPALADAIVARSEGNPFFAEELLAAAGDESGELPRGLRELLLQRVARLDRRTQGRAAAGGGGRARRRLPAAPRRGGAPGAATCASRCAAPSSTASSSPTGRRAASASATRCSPRRSTRRCFPASARSCTRGSPTSSRAANRRRPRPSSRRTGRRQVALGRRSSRRSRLPARPRRSSAWPRRSRTSSGRSRCGPTCRTPPSSRGLDLAELSSWAAEQAILTGAAPRAVELGRQAVALVGDGDPVRAGLLHARLGRYLLARRSAATPASPRSSARSSSCRHSRPRRSARRCWRRSDTR